MEIKISPEKNIEVLELSKGEVQILDGSPRVVFFKVKSDKEHVGEVLEELVTIVLSQDAKIRGFDVKNTTDYINFNKSFVQRSLDKILENDLAIGDSVRLSGKLEHDGLYSVALITNNEDRTLKMADGRLSFKEWFLDAVRNYKPVTIEE
jgi:hypothetical protein